MASPAQVAANQANSLKSTGPRSVEGKSVSRFNALKHGIDAQSIVIPGEDPHQYAALAEAYHREYRPESPLRSLPRRHHASRRLAETPPRARRSRPHPHPPPESNGASLAAALLADPPAAT